MARTFTSTGAGNWNDSTKWDVGGGAYPGDTIGEVDTVNIGHAIVYNVAAPVEFINGVITITSGGSLTASRTASTLLQIGHQDLIVNSGGTFDWGTSASPIPAAYVAKIEWNTTSDNAKGLKPSSGATVSAYGHGDYYGSLRKSYLQAAWTSVAAAGASTIYTKVDVEGKWAIGQEIAIHYRVAGTSTCSVDNWAVATITSVGAWDGTKNAIGITVIYNGKAAATVYPADGIIIMLSRNVIFGKYGASKNAGSTNSNRPYIIYEGGTGYADFAECAHVEFIGINRLSVNLPGSFSDCVSRNGSHAYRSYSAFSHKTIIRPTCFSMSQTLSGTGFDYIDAPIICGGTGNPLGLTCGIINDAILVGSSGYYGTTATIIDGLYSYGNYIGFSSYLLGYIKNGVFSQDEYGNSTPNWRNLYCQFQLDAKLINCLEGSATNADSTFNDSRYLWSLKRLHYNQVIDAYYATYCTGTVSKVSADGGGAQPRPNQRTGGNATILEVLPLSAISSDWKTKVPFLFGAREPLQVWGTSGVALTLRLYIQSEYAMSASECVLFASYLTGTGGNRTEVDSTGGAGISVRSGATDWSQYLEVTLTPGADGWIWLWAECYKYSAAADYFWVDPLVDGLGAGSVVWTEDGPVFQPAGGGILSHPGMRGGLNG